MDEDRSKKYESIDALIMAAEVLERAEAMAKKQLTLKDNFEISNFCVKNLNNNDSNDKYNIHRNFHGNEQDDQFTDGLLNTIYYIKDLQTTERWTELLESKDKTEHRILFRELSDLKKKFKKVTGISTKSNQMITVHDEDEDTSTASEDEDYNKYDRVNVVDCADDITDDASECEETLNISLHQINERTKNQRMMTIDNHLQGAKSYTSRITNRKRKHARKNQYMSATSRLRPCYLSEDPSIHRAAHHHRHCIGHTSLSLLNLHRRTHSVHCKSLLKARQPVDT